MLKNINCKPIYENRRTKLHSAAWKTIEIVLSSFFFLLALSQQTEEHVFLILSSVTAMAENI